VLLFAGKTRYPVVNEAADALEKFYASVAEMALARFVPAAFEHRQYGAEKAPAGARRFFG
jgi:hypothetical protein